MPNLLRNLVTAGNPRCLYRTQSGALTDACVFRVTFSGGSDTSTCSNCTQSGSAKMTSGTPWGVTLDFGYANDLSYGCLYRSGTGTATATFFSGNTGCGGFSTST